MLVVVFLFHEKKTLKIIKTENANICNFAPS